MNLYFNFPEPVKQFEYINYLNARNDDPEFMEFHMYYGALQKYSVFIVPIRYDGDKYMSKSEFLVKKVFRLNKAK